MANADVLGARTDTLALFSSCVEEVCSTRTLQISLPSPNWYRVLRPIYFYPGKKLMSLCKEVQNHQEANTQHWNQAIAVTSWELCLNVERDLMIWKIKPNKLAIKLRGSFGESQKLAEEDAAGSTIPLQNTGRSLRGRAQRFWSVTLQSDGEKEKILSSEISNENTA